VKNEGVGSPFQAGFMLPTLLGSSEAADTHQRLQISLVGPTADVVGSPEQDGMMPARVIEMATKQYGGLGVLEEAGESFGRGGLTGKGTGEKIGGLGSPQRMSMLLIDNFGRFTGGLDASETVDTPQMMPVVANPICGEGFGCSQGDDTTQSLMEASPEIGDRILVPWSPWESNFEGKKGAVACTTPASDPSSRLIGSVEAVKPGRDVNLGSERHAPLNVYDPKSGNEAGYSDWVIQCTSEIYPIVGILYVGHKLQLLALLTFLKGEHHKDAMGTNSRSGVKGRREVKNLESLVNYDGKGASASRGKSIVIL
jgi:hypothetical protein